MSDDQLSRPSPSPTSSLEEAQRTSRRVVVGVDDSPGSLAALRWALAEARLRDAGVHLVRAWRHSRSYGQGSVWSLMDRSGATRKAAADAADSALERLAGESGGGNGVPVTWEAVEGHPAEVLVRVGDGAELLVVGMRGHGSFPDALPGSVSQHVAAHARCPVVLVAGPERDHPNGRIVVGVDGSSGSLAALNWSVEEAKLRGASVEPTMAWEHISGPGATAGWAVGMGGPSEDKEPVQAIAHAEIHRLGDEAVKGRGVKVSPQAIEGHPARVLLSRAEGADLLVVGTRGHGGFVGALLGSVSRHVLAHAPCPVVLIPDPGRRRERHA